MKKLEDAVRFLRKTFGEPPLTAFVLGSGLGDFLDDVQDYAAVRFKEIPGFPQATVAGHKGALGIGDWEGRKFLAVQGRAHWYEGVSQWQIVFPVRALARWGVQEFVITNAAGAINTDLRPGSFMVISDHLNLLGENPLSGPNLDSLGERFPDMTRAYDRELLDLGYRCAQRLGLDVWQGVYAAVKGPSFETPAEIRMLRLLGADAVGMSTVPEVIALNHMRRKVLGISCITNLAAGIVGDRMLHQDVLTITGRVQQDFARLLLTILQEREGSS